MVFHGPLSFSYALWCRHRSAYTKSRWLQRQESNLLERVPLALHVFRASMAWAGAVCVAGGQPAALPVSCVAFVWALAPK